MWEFGISLEGPFKLDKKAQIKNWQNFDRCAGKWCRTKEIQNKDKQKEQVVVRGLIDL